MYLSEYVSVYEAQNLNLSADSAAMLGWSVRSLEKFSGPVAVAALSAQIVLPWLKARLSQVARKTVHRERGDVMTLWRAAHRDGYCPTPPADIPRIKVPTQQPVAYLDDEAEAILRVASSRTGRIRGTTISRADWWVSLLLFLYDTGARPKAALAVRLTDVDWSRRIARLRGECAKTGAEQYARFSQQTADVMAKHWDASRPFVWPWPHSLKELRERYRWIVQQSGVRPDRSKMMYAWRRTCATQVARIVGVSAAQRQLGHSSEAMTRRYIDPTLLSESTAADILPRLRLPD